MERLTFDGNFCDIALCSEVRYGSFCEDGSCSQRRVWERLKSIEDILGGDYNLDRFRELVQADRIRAMSDEELGKFLYGYFWGRLPVLPNREEKLLDWLQQPAEEGD